VSASSSFLLPPPSCPLLPSLISPFPLPFPSLSFASPNKDLVLLEGTIQLHSLRPPLLRKRIKGEKCRAAGRRKGEKERSGGRWEEKRREVEELVLSKFNIFSGALF
jgi:hypothetical protein